MAYSFTMGRSNTATVTFDCPTSGSTQLGGGPAFTQRTETSGTVQGTYAYSVGTTVTTITRPDTSTTDRRGNRTTTRADIYFAPGFFDKNDSDYQGSLFFHEMLHAALDRSDADLVGDFHIDATGESNSQAIQDWLAGGCQ